MKRKLLIIFSIVVLIIGGYFIFNEFKKKQLVNEAQEKAEEYVTENYEKIEEIRIDPEINHFDPVGGLSIGGYINKNEELYFYITFTVNNNEVGEVDTIAEAPNFPLEKDE